MKKLIYTLFIGVFAIGITACKSGESISTNPASIQGDWVIMGMNGQEVASQNYTLSFNLDGTVAGIAVCNRFAGTYDAQQEGVLSLNSVAATQIECESDTEAYLGAVKAASSFKVIGGDELKLTSSDGNTLVFSKVVVPGQEG